MRKERIMDEEEIIGFEALYESMGKCQKGVLWKDSVAHFVLNGIEEILKLENQLKNGGDVGYNPGSQMVQLAGISVLNPLDHYIKEELGIESYTRYMDDFLLIHPDREYLEYCRMQIESMLKKDGFSLNKKKTRIYPISEGIKFLGFIFKLTGTGKVLRLIDPNNVKRERRKLRRAVAKAKRGEITREKVDQMFGSWKAHALGSKKKHVKGKKETAQFQE